MRRNPQGMRFAALMLNLCCCCTFAATHHQCQLRPTNFEGWKAEELSNDWVRLAIVPQLGGRLMQVTFAGHSYLFVNPEYKGQYFPPSGKNNGKWFNYGGDKLWPLPEGRQDEQHWAGLADDPSFNIADGLFLLHWQYLENEVWLDSTAGWLAVADNSTRYAMIERFQYIPGADYPGKASIIFYKNGAALELDDKGLPHLRSSTREDTPYYMEAEINSPMIRLAPGESYAMDTQWLPTRAGKDLKDVTNAGIIERPLAAYSTVKGIRLSGSFGVLYPGKLIAHFYDAHGVESRATPLLSVDPAIAVDLEEELEVPRTTERVSIHLIDGGRDRGSLGECKVVKTN